MTKKLSTLLVFCLAASAGLGARIAIAAPTFELLLEDPGPIIALPGSAVEIPITARLVSVLDDPDQGAQGWSVDLKNRTPSLFSFVDATVQGTVGADVTDSPPGLRNNGFEHTELTTGPDGPRAVSAVVLSLTEDVKLGAGTSDILNLTLRGTAPPNGTTDLWSLAFDDGLDGSEEPVLNRIASEGQSFLPSLGELSISVTGDDQAEPPPADRDPRLDLTFDAGSESFIGLAGAPLQIPVTAQLVSSLDADGVQGWQLSVSSTGANIVAASLDGTSGALIDDDPPGLRTDGGFGIAELTSGVDNEGAVSGVVLGSGVSLPADGTFDLLSLTLEGTAPDPGVTETWTVFYQDGLQGSGQPLDNIMVVDGQSLLPVLTPLTVSVTGFMPAEGGGGDGGGAVVPEPPSAALALLGLAALGLFAGRNRFRRHGRA